MLVNGGFDTCVVGGTTCPGATWEYDQGNSGKAACYTYFTGLASNCFTYGAPCAVLACDTKYAGFHQTVKNLAAGSPYIFKFWMKSAEGSLPNGLQIIIDGQVQFNLTSYQVTSEHSN